MNLVELCRSIISIDSSESHGTKEVAQFVVEKARSLGLEVEQFDENQNGLEQRNILISPQPLQNKDSILLSSRLDTQDPGHYANWIKNGANPFSASISGNEIYGLGVADAKADFVCKLAALQHFKGKNLPNAQAVLLGTFGGQSGSGAIRFFRKKKFTIKGAIVGTPTNLRLATKAPGFAKVEISIPFSEEERSYHKIHNETEGSVSQTKFFTRSTDGVISHEFQNNPIFKLLDYLKRLPLGTTVISVDGGTTYGTEPDSVSLEIDLVESRNESVLEKLVHIGDSIKELAADLKSISDSDFTPAHSTITVGQIRTFPEEIKILGFCRLVPAPEKDVYEKWLEKLRVRCQGVNAQFHILDFKPPFSCVPKKELAEATQSCLKKLNKDFQFTSAAACTEANVLSKLGVDVMCFGPGDGQVNKGHVSSEHVRIDDLETARDFYIDVIGRLCQ